MESEVQHIISLLKKTFEQKAWHGPTVRETLENLSPDQAFNRLPNTHSIIELVAHMTTWRTYITRKLGGDNDYKVTDDLNFPRAENWDETVKALHESQAQLLAAIEAFAPADLMQQVPWTNEPYTYYAILHGIIHHDLYHVGQINLIHKAGLAQPL